MDAASPSPRPPAAPAALSSGTSAAPAPAPAPAPLGAQAPGGEAATPPVQTPLGPLVLAKGDRVRIGSRTGRVEDIRGNWTKPYDVRIRWEGEPRPEYVVFGSLELEYAKGRLVHL